MKKLNLSLAILSLIVLFSCNNPSTNSNSSFESKSSSTENTLTGEKVYLNFDSSENVKVTLSSVSSITSVKINDEEIDANDYNYENNVLIIRNTLVKSYGYGELSLKINDELNYIIVVYSTKDPILLTELPVTYLGYKNLEFSFELYSHKFDSVTFNDEILSKYIKFENSSLIIEATLIETLGPGIKDFIVTLNNDTPEGINSKKINIQTKFIDFSA